MVHRRLRRMAEDILGERDGQVAMPNRGGEENTLPRGFKVHNNGENPISDVTTILPRYHPPRQPPKMSKIGLEGSCMPRRAVPDDREMFRGCGCMPSDRQLMGNRCMPTDGQLFGHMRTKTDKPRRK